MGTVLGLNEDVSTPEGAARRCRDLAERAVTNTRALTGTKEAAIYSLTRRYRFGSWLTKLVKGHKVTLHLHYYERLCRAVEESAREVERIAQRDREIIEAIRGSDAARQGIAADRRGAGDGSLHEDAAVVDAAA